MYKVKTIETARGIKHYFVGPGLHQYDNEVHFMQLMNEWANKCCGKRGEMPENNNANQDADCIVRLLSGAFEAGKKEAKRVLRDLLEVPHR